MAEVCLREQTDRWATAAWAAGFVDSSTNERVPHPARALSEWEQWLASEPEARVSMAERVQQFEAEVRDRDERGAA